MKENPRDPLDGGAAGGLSVSPGAWVRYYGRPGQRDRPGRRQRRDRRPEQQPVDPPQAPRLADRYTYGPHARTLTERWEWSVNGGQRAWVSNAAGELSGSGDAAKRC